MDNAEYATIIKFVERKMPTDEFLKHLYEDEQLQELLQQKLSYELPSFRSCPEENLFLFLCEQDMHSLGGLIDALGELEKFLTSKQVEFEKDDEAVKLYGLLLSSQPAWLDLPDFYFQKLLEVAGDRKGIELKKFLKEEIKKRFKCMKGTPRWLQGGNWVFVDGEPLLFVGQLDITEIRHDTSRLYIFLDEKTGQYHTIEQSM